MVTSGRMQRRVSVVGIGVVSPFGTSLETFRDALLQGRTGIAPITDFDTKECRSTLAANVTGFDAPTWIPPMKLRRMDRTGAYAIAASSLAMEDARQTRSDDGVDDSGVMLGTWTAGGQATQDYLSALFRTGPSGAPALLFNSTVANAAASLVGLEFKLRGPNATVSYKEASGLAAIVSATEMIREGHASALAAGGVDAVYEIFFKAYDRFRVMSPAADAGRATGAVRRVAQRVRARRGRIHVVARAGRWRGSRAARRLTEKFSAWARRARRSR